MYKFRQALENTQTRVRRWQVDVAHARARGTARGRGRGPRASARDGPAPLLRLSRPLLARPVFFKKITHQRPLACFFLYEGEILIQGSQKTVLHVFTRPLRSKERESPRPELERELQWRLAALAYAAADVAAARAASASRATPPSQKWHLDGFLKITVAF